MDRGLRDNSQGSACYNRGIPSDNGHPPQTAQRIAIDEMSRRLRSELIPIDRRFSYFLGVPIAEEDLRQYLQDPIASLPPAACALLPEIGIVLAPYLERGVNRGPISVAYEKPPEAKLVFSASTERDGFATLFFTVRDEEVSDYHYYFFDELAALLSWRWPEKVQETWHGLLSEELSAEVHGEVDDRSWHLKQTLLRRPKSTRKSGKPFNEYARQSFEDTMTLYLHGICCDIDVEAGPRQIPSRFLRKRLVTLKSLFPPAEGHAVFPEDVNPKN